MTHCTPEATLKPICFQLMPKTVSKTVSQTYSMPGLENGFEKT